MATHGQFRQTPLHALHLELGGKMVPFAGYEMPVQYPAGILKEHLHTRAKAGLFDVSHMGQAFLSGADPAAALERLTPADVVGLRDGQQRYGLLLNDAGTILDDFMVARLAGEAALFSSSMQPRRKQTSPISRRSSRASPHLHRSPSERCWRSRGRPPRLCSRVTRRAPHNCRS